MDHMERKVSKASQLPATLEVWESFMKGKYFLVAVFVSSHHLDLIDLISRESGDDIQHNWLLHRKIATHLELKLKSIVFQMRLLYKVVKLIYKIVRRIVTILTKY